MTNIEPTPTQGEIKQPILGDSTYDKAKDAVTIWLPAAATLYATLASIFHWPLSTEIVAAVGAVVIFLGTILKISADRYAAQPVAFNGQLYVNRTDPMQETHKLEIDQPWDELGKLNEVRIQVIDTTPTESPLSDNGRN
jgi:hypothetical protein